MKIIIISFLLAGISLFAESKTRHYASDGKPLAEGTPGVMSLECATPQEWSDSCQPEFLVIENGKIRFKTAEEKAADIAAAEQSVALSVKSFAKLDIRRAMRALGNEAALDAILNGNATFKADWSDAVEINLDDTAVQSALQSMQVDVNAIKLKIAELKKIK